MYQQNQNINIWQEALKQKTVEPTLSTQQRTVIILGSGGSGKSSLLKLLRNDTSQEIKSTILFEYSYIKRQSINKEILHCYELSNKNQQEIIPSLINKENFNKTKIVICVDLSKGGNIINDIKQWIEIVRKQIQMLCREKMTVDQKVKEYQNTVTKSISDNEDFSVIKPMPIQTIIVGCKYDLLEKQDSENRKWLSRALRYFALTNYCHLFFSSTLNSTVCSQIRNVFNEVFFGSKRTFYSQKDHLKPIFISQGQDTIQSLNVSTSANLNVLEVIKKQMSALFGNEDGENKKQVGQVDLSKYSEGKIDSLIEERRKEMLKITKGNKDGIGMMRGR